MHVPTTQPPDQTGRGELISKCSASDGNATDDDKHTSHSDSNNSDDDDDIFLGIGTTYELQASKPTEDATAVQIPTDLFTSEEEKTIAPSPNVENSEPTPTLGVVNQMISRLAKRKHAPAEHDGDGDGDDSGAKRTK
ncbi:hypothetical protein IWQ62_003426 [Dispira parvispora]|uniref:Uncharacterized protein n=1 Tax=Dispira parvispora TaxID=1520584 RepID=A0A9W8ANH6_9FUNG|nr:hypothetical protein IWQ62_003426 [Dispira parvispora]